MKHLLSILFTVTTLLAFGQAKIGISPVVTFTPSSANSPSSTVSYGTPVAFTSYVKNYGNATYTGTAMVFTKRDTLMGSFLDSVLVNLTLMPSDSVSVISTFTPSSGPTAFKVAGNGNTIVVWPLINTGGGLQGDSLRVPVWVNGYSSILEMDNNVFNIYPNPVVKELHIATEHTNQYKKIIVYDMYARKVKEIEFTTDVDVSSLTAGRYWMIISSDERWYRVSFIKE